MGAEGIPYEFETFTQLCVVTVPGSLDTGQPWKPDCENRPVVRKHEFIIDYAVVPVKKKGRGVRPVKPASLGSFWVGASTT